MHNVDVVGRMFVNEIRANEVKSVRGTRKLKNDQKSQNKVGEKKAALAVAAFFFLNHWTQQITKCGRKQ